MLWLFFCNFRFLCCITFMHHVILFWCTSTLALSINSGPWCHKIYRCFLLSYCCCISLYYQCLCVSFSIIVTFDTLLKPWKLLWTNRQIVEKQINCIMYWKGLFTQLGWRLRIMYIKKVQFYFMHYRCRVIICVLCVQFKFNLPCSCI